MRVVYRTFGCRLNQYETDAMARDLAVAGHSSVAAEADADLVIVNTCTVTAVADREARRTVRRLVERVGPGRVVVTGCSSQRDPAPYAAIPGVRLVTGNEGKTELRRLLAETEPLVPGPVPVRVAPPPGPPVERVRTLLSGGRSAHARAYLRVQDGCNQRCTFCTLPSVRGTSASLPLDAVREEARRLAGAGHRELVLTGAHLGSYGYDLAPRVPLAALIEAVLAAAPEARVRLSSLEPRFVSAELLRLLEHETRLCPHLHLPLQSGDDGVLSRMKRAYRSGPYVRRARAAVEAVARGRGGEPGLALGSDFIVGFPGEDERAFEATMERVRELPFTYGHVFPYSNRPGTPAAALPDPVPPETLRRRSAALRSLLDRRRRAYREAHRGRRAEIVVERVEPAVGYPGWRARGTSESFLAVIAEGPGAAPRVGARLAVRVEAVEGENLLARLPERRPFTEEVPG